MIDLAIITPLKRLENLPILLSSIRSTMNENINVYWFIIFDKSEEESFAFWETRLNYLGNEYENFIVYPILSPVANALAGHAHRNIALHAIKKICKKDILVYNLDDDNVIHPKLFYYLTSNEKAIKNKSAIIFEQQFKDGRLRLNTNRIEVCHVDTAMFIFRLKYLKTLLYLENDYCADGHFIQAFYESNKKKVLIINESLCYYNYLQQKE